MTSAIGVQYPRCVDTGQRRCWDARIHIRPVQRCSDVRTAGLRLKSPQARIACLQEVAVVGADEIKLTRRRRIRGQSKQCKYAAQYPAWIWIRERPAAIGGDCACTVTRRLVSPQQRVLNCRKPAETTYSIHQAGKTCHIHIGEVTGSCTIAGSPENCRSAEVEHIA